MKWLMLNSPYRWLVLPAIVLLWPQPSMAHEAGEGEEISGSIGGRAGIPGQRRWRSAPGF